MAEAGEPDLLDRDDEDPPGPVDDPPVALPPFPLPPMARPPVPPRVPLSWPRTTVVWLVSLVIVVVLVVLLRSGNTTHDSPDHASGHDPVPYGFRIHYTVHGEPDEHGDDTTTEVHVTHLLCHHVGTPDAIQWVHGVRESTKENRQNMFKQRPALIKERDQQCLSTYYLLGYDLQPVDLALLRQHMPLSFSVLGAGVGMDDYVDKLVSAARALGPRGLQAMRPGMTRLFYQPSHHEDIVRHVHITGLPGRVLYRVAVLWDDGHIRLRTVDHHALVAALDTWLADFIAGLGRLGHGIQLQETRCLCMAHLGILGSGIHIARGRSVGMDTDTDDTWRFLVNATVVRQYETRTDTRGYVIPTPRIHAWPAALDQVYLDELGLERDETLRIGYKTAMFQYYEATPSTLAKLWPLSHGGSTEFESDVRKARQKVEAFEEEGTGAPPPTQSLVERLQELAWGHQKMRVPALILPLGTHALVQHEGNADTTRCFTYCQHLEAWLLGEDVGNATATEL